jgi:putative restriction endonuclease
LIKNGRGKMFVEEVLNAYKRKCAVCGQSIRLGDSLIGIDACHLKPLQHFGSDKIDNGLALCKFHHWALDRGAMTISTDFKVLISPKINGGEADRYLISYEGKSIFQPREKEKLIFEGNILYHNAYIFSK